jgi:hypothetical protein
MTDIVATPAARPNSGGDAGAPKRVRRKPRPGGWTRAGTLGLLAAASCAGGAGGAGQPGLVAAPPPVHAPGPPGTATAQLAGGRCRDGRCTCRKPGDHKAEDPPPLADHKRFEIRVGAENGFAVVESPTLGQLNGAGPPESCFYVDVPAGSSHEVTFFAQEAKPTTGVSPTLTISEYGPKGPYWYDIINVQCRGINGRCTREAAEEWGDYVKRRKRGRIDPCGSTVVTKLGWATSGGTAERDAGFFRDFTVTFDMEVKRFATQFAPGSTECVPK